MIETTQLGNKLIELLHKTETIPENGTIDFKLEPHPKGKDCELFKDILALANSFSRPNEDRWLIYGVVNQTRELKGIPRNHSDLLDDANYQQKFAKIRPSLHVEFLTIPASHVREDLGDDKVFAAFYIPYASFGEVYELSTVIEDRAATKGKVTKYHEGTSFVRIGSSTSFLCEEHRVRIRGLANSRIPMPAMQYGKYDVAVPNGVMTGLLDNLVLLGSWDEDNENDKAFISRLCEAPYSSVIRNLRDSLDAGVFVVHGAKWKVADHKEQLQIVGKHLTGTALRVLAEPFASAISMADGKYAMPEDKRILANVSDVDRGTSDTVREGIASLCAILSNERCLLPKCSDADIDLFIRTVIDSVIATDDWRILASNDFILPLLAEASPQIFLHCVKKGLSSSEAIHQFLSEKDGGIVPMNLGWGFTRGIQIAAMPTESFPRALSLSQCLLTYSSLMEDAIVNILLPWLPSTEASPKTRMGAGRFLAQKDEDSWKVLMKLLPGVTTTKIGNPKPVYMKVSDFDEGPLVSEYWEVSRSYCRDALEGAHGNVDRILDIVSNVNSFKTADLIDELCDMVREEVPKVSEYEQYRVWSCMCSCLNKHDQYKDAEWALSKEGREKLREVVGQITPADSYYAALRLLSLSEWELIDHRNKRNEEHDKLKNLRVNTLCGLYKDYGISIVERLINDGAKGSITGYVLAGIEFEEKDCQAVLAFLAKDMAGNSELGDVARSYAWAKTVNVGLDWIDALPISEWPSERVARLYASLPISRIVWTKAEEALGKDASLFWDAIPPDLIFDNCQDTETFASRMLAANRALDAIGTLAWSVEQGLLIDASLISESLEGLRVSELGSTHSYHIGSLLEYLENTSPGDSLFALEFRFAATVMDRSDAYIYTRISNDPNAFVEVASIACGRHHDSEGRENEIDGATRYAVYGRLLAHWIIAPGTDATGVFSSDVFNEWVERVESRAEDEKELSFFRHLIGRNLFHAPSSDDFFIPKSVADYLESSDDTLNGYSEESINSRGVHYVDPTGKPEDDLADAYTDKAEAAEANGYMRFATTLRKIARMYRAEAEENRRERDG